MQFKMKIQTVSLIMKENSYHHFQTTTACDNTQLLPMSIFRKITFAENMYHQIFQQKSDCSAMNSCSRCCLHHETIPIIVVGVTK